MNANPTPVAVPLGPNLRKMLDEARPGVCAVLDRHEVPALGWAWRPGPRQILALPERPAYVLSSAERQLFDRSISDPIYCLIVDSLPFFRAVSADGRRDPGSERIADLQPSPPSQEAPDSAFVRRLQDGMLRRRKPDPAAMSDAAKESLAKAFSGPELVVPAKPGASPVVAPNGILQAGPWHVFPLPPEGYPSRPHQCLDVAARAWHRMSWHPECAEGTVGRQKLTELLRLALAEAVAEDLEKRYGLPHDAFCHDDCRGAKFPDRDERDFHEAVTAGHFPLFRRDVSRVEGHGHGAALDEAAAAFRGRVDAMVARLCDGKVVEAATTVEGRSAHVLAGCGLVPRHDFGVVTADGKVFGIRWGDSRTGFDFPVRHAGVRTYRLTAAGRPLEFATPPDPFAAWLDRTLEPVAGWITRRSGGSGS